MTVDGVPNVRVCTEPIREGAVVEGQNVRWSLDFDFMSLTDKVGGPFTPVGFYYRTFIRPRAAWPLYEKFLRGAAGLGKLDPHAGHTRRYDTEHRRARVLVVGGGEAGRAAALEAAKAGPGVVLVDEDARVRAISSSPGVEVLAPASALGIWEGGLVPVDAGTVLYRFRAERIVVATGATEQPLVFPGNDLVGVMLPDGVRRLIRDFSIKPGERAVVLGADDETLAIADELEEVGIEVAKVVDLRDARPRELAAQGGKGRVRRLVLDGESYACDLLVASGGRQPAYSLLAQAGARIEYDDALGVFVPTELPDGRRGGRQRDGRGSVEGRARARVSGQGQVLRLRLRGRDDEGHEARDRRGLRLDRARQALHDGDDGPVPGQALPPLEHPRLRAGEPDVRVRDRHDDCASAVGAGRARAARGPRADAGATRLDPLAPRGGGRDDPVGRAVEAAVRVRREARGRGARRPRVARRHRRLDAGQAPRRRARTRSRSSSGSTRTASAT